MHNIIIKIIIMYIICIAHGLLNYKIKYNYLVFVSFTSTICDYLILKPSLTRSPISYIHANNLCNTLNRT